MTFFNAEDFRPPYPFLVSVEMPREEVCAAIANFKRDAEIEQLRDALLFINEQLENIEGGHATECLKRIHASLNYSERRNAPSAGQTRKE